MPVKKAYTRSSIVSDSRPTNAISDGFPEEREVPLYEYVPGMDITSNTFQAIL